MQERRVIRFLLVGGLLLGGSALEAQINPLIPQLSFGRSDVFSTDRVTELGEIPVQFDLAPPGARSLGMGGAFIAIADDATASEANPAGLTILTKPEFSFHLRDSSFDGEIDDTKAAIAFRVANQVRADEGNPNRVPARTNPICGAEGTPACTPIDATASRKTASDTATDVSFVSYVKPFARWVFSVYYNRFANFSSNSVLRGPGGSVGFVDSLLFDTYSGTTRSEILAESIGISGAFKINEDLAFGVSVRATELDVNNSDFFRIDYFSDLELSTFIVDFGDTFEPFRLDPGQFTDILISQETALGNDTDLTYNLGLLWNAGGKVSAGVVLKKGGDFEIPATSLLFDCLSFQGVPPEDLARFLPGGVSNPCNTTDFTGGDFLRGTLNDRGQIESVNESRRITIPDLLGFGLAVRPNDRLTLAADLNLITYSDLGSPVIPGITEAIDDELELHVGGEYVFLPRGSDYPVTVRAGYFNEPDHDGFVNVDSADDHFTVGTGMAFKRDYQFDLAASFSDRQDVVLFSVVYRR